MAALGDETRIRDLMDGVNTGITLQSFERVFRSVPYAEHLQSRVLEDHVRWFFRQADEFLRLREAGAGIDEKTLVRDYQRCKKLIARTQERLQQLRTLVQKSQIEGPSRTAPVARFILDSLKQFETKLTEIFEETHREHRGQSTTTKDAPPQDWKL